MIMYVYDDSDKTYKSLQNGKVIKIKGPLPEVLDLRERVTDMAKLEEEFKKIKRHYDP